MHLRTINILAVASVSGMCALVYQVVWDRMLRDSFGGDTVSSAIVTGTFLLGLGIGAFVFRRCRYGAFRTYALVEVGIGVFAIGSAFYLSELSTQLARLLSYSIDDLGGVRLVVVAASVLFLAVPTTLMGGTLPLMFACFMPAGEYKGSRVGAIYGANTAGAATGIGLAPFVLLNHWSFATNLTIVGCLNLALGGWIFAIGRRQPEHPTHRASEWRASMRFDPTILLLSFVTGFAVLSYEIVLFRLLAVTNGPSPYTFPVALGFVLIAISMGSTVFTRSDTSARPAILHRVGWLLTLGAVAATLGVVIGATIVAAGRPVAIHDWEYGSAFVFITVLAFPVPFFVGAAFPNLLRAASASGEELSLQTGRLYLVNSLGAFVGALGTQFVGFAFFGVRWVLVGVVALVAAAGWLCLDARIRWARPVGGAAVGLAAVMALLTPAEHWQRLAVGNAGDAVDSAEGLTGFARLDWDDEGRARVVVNGQFMSALPHHPKHIMLEALALMPEERSDVLVLGVGAAAMIKTLVDDPGVERIDAIDWSAELPAVLRSPRASSMLAAVLDAPRVNLIWADARLAVALYAENSFDVVVDNLVVGDQVGATGLKSVSYYQEIRRILRPGGLLVISANYSSPRQRLANLAAIRTQFAEVLESGSTAVVASDRPVRFDEARVSELLEPRRAALGAQEPFATWLFSGLSKLDDEEIRGIEPIRADLVVFEYKLHPLRFFFDH